MKVAGIDLSGPRNVADTHLVVFDERGGKVHLIESHAGAEDRQIIESIAGLKDKQIVIGIDAPLSYNAGGGDRLSDAELRRLVNQKAHGVGIMPPTMIRMVYLTLRGIALTRMLESLRMNSELRIVEVHPGACMLLRGAIVGDVKGFKHDPIHRAHMLDWLETRGIKGITKNEPVSDHFVAACGAALGAWQWELGNSVWCFPAEPPQHPYDFAC